MQPYKVAHRQHRSYRWHTNSMYPLTFTATQADLTASPQTRVSDYDDVELKSKWTKDDQIKVEISGGGNDMATTCTLDESGNITTYNPELFWNPLTN